MHTRLAPAVVVMGIAGMALGQSSVAILRNFDDNEIDRMVLLLEEMGHEVTVFDQGELTVDSAPTFDLVMWNDISFANDGLQNDDVLALDAAHQAGVPLYLLGDDLAYCYGNLDATQDATWQSLLHLAEGINIVPDDGTMEIVRVHHPVIDGPFGVIGDYSCGIDPDGAVATSTGEIVLGIVDTWDALLAYPASGDGTRSVTQNVLLTDGIQADQPIRDALFKNATAWLLDQTICRADCDVNGVLNVVDFVCFQQAWTNQAPLGDCDGSGTHDILDFVCYQLLFSAGCP